MKQLIILFLSIAILTSSCETDPGIAIANDIIKLEKTVEESPTVDNINNLVAKYNEYTKVKPNDDEWNGRYLYRGASKLLKTNNKRGAIDGLSRAVKNYGSSSATPNSLFLLAETYKNDFRNVEMANVFYQCIAEGFPDHEYAAKAKSMRTDNKTLDGYIQEVLDSDIFLDSLQTRVNPAKAGKLIDLYTLYSSVLEDEKTSPEYLYKTYELANSVRKFKEAEAACEQLHRKYPNHEKAATCLFLVGYLNENELKNLDKAKKVYTSFLKEYPNNDFAKDAKFALENLGKPADQILQELQNKK